MTPIVSKGDPVLRRVAKEVPLKAIGGPKIAAILGLCMVFSDTSFETFLNTVLPFWTMEIIPTILSLTEIIDKRINNCYKGSRFF